MLPRNKKIIEKRPCIYFTYDREKKRWEEAVPDVLCSTNCVGCGWDAEEQKRRLETGEWVFDENGVKHLLFKSVKPKEELIPV